MRILLGAASDSAIFSQILLEHASQLQRDGTTRVRAILERLEDYTRDDIPIEHIPSIISSFFNIGDELLKKEDERRGMFDFGNEIRIGRILYQLLSRLEENQRFQILYEAIKAGVALSIAEDRVAFFGQQHGKFGEKEPSPKSEQTVNAEQLEALEQLVLQKIRTSAENGTLITTPKLVSVLWRWKAWSNKEEEIKEWISEITKSDEGLAKLLEHFGSIQQIQSSENLASERYYRLDPKWLEPFIQPEKIINQVRLLAERMDLPKSQVAAAKQFIKEYELREQGQNPDNLWKP
jgi:predicted KAP-like P-loop ATPase